MKPKHPTIPMSPCKSSMIESIGYLGDTLAVKFKGAAGVTHHYPGVSAADFAALQKAESVGGHFGKYIRPKYKSIKIDPQ